MNLANNAQNLGFPGWKAFDNSRNRFAIINDYLDGAMKPFRQLQYDYYRNGLDEMVTNAERGRANITTALETGRYGLTISVTNLPIFIRAKARRRRSRPSTTCSLPSTQARILLGRK